jgi:ABC-type transporter Mla MlaB component
MSDGDSPVTTITMSGPKTLYESNEVRDLLRSAFESGLPVRLDLETSGPWDFAGLQLLVSAVATGKEYALPVRLVNVPRVCAEIAERSGLREWLAEHADSFL